MYPQYNENMIIKKKERKTSLQEMLKKVLWVEMRAHYTVHLKTRKETKIPTEINTWSTMKVRLVVTMVCDCTFYFLHD
jgi:hypothetical protein